MVFQSYESGLCGRPLFAHPVTIVHATKIMQSLNWPVITFLSYPAVQLYIPSPELASDISVIHYLEQCP